MSVKISLNGKLKELDFEAGEYLLDVLRRYGYYSLRRGCDTNSCSACTILFDGKPVHACSLLAARTEGHEVITIEGIKDEAELISDFIMDEGVDQCGYCGPGLIMTIYAMKRDLDQPDDEEILDYLKGNLCRCTGYVGQLKAVRKYLEV